MHESDVTTIFSGRDPLQLSQHRGVEIYQVQLLSSVLHRLLILFAVPHSLCPGSHRIRIAPSVRRHLLNQVTHDLFF